MGPDEPPPANRRILAHLLYQHERFDHPTLEMNTYVTSLMVDLLGAKGTPVGWREAWSEHGRISPATTKSKPTGGVRYHGRPDGPAMTAHGLFFITPEIVVALLGYGASLPVTSVTLHCSGYTYCVRRTAVETCWGNEADTAVSTWVRTEILLTSPFRCICSCCWHKSSRQQPIPYAMRSSARSIKTASGFTIARHHWFPCCASLTCKQLAVQCSYRWHACRPPCPGQDVWLTAIQMLQRLEIKHEQAPNSAQVLDLLRALSRDDFTAVRLNPPLLYHNDFTASVPRFYWSEDVGYAIWLRLYLASERHGFLSPHGGNHKNIAGTSTVPNPS